MLSHNIQAASALSINRQRILEALKAIFVTQVIVHYQGGSDEGHVTDIVIHPKSKTHTKALARQQLAFSFVRGTYKNGCDHYFLVDKPLSVGEALRVFVVMWIDLHHSGWENDHGGSGIMTIHVATDQFVLEHDQYATEPVHYHYCL